MASLTDIIITIAATENITETFQNIQNSGSKLKSTLGAMATGAGLAMANYGKDAVQSAITAETEWNRFGANLQNQGLDWNNLSSEVKNYISDFSNQMGRGVADTRSAATALMNYGMSWDEVKGSMNGVAGLAASIGGTEEEASQIIISALNGRAQALRKATGLQIEDYKAADGSIDRARLFKDITDRTKNARLGFADSDAAKLQRITNDLNKLKTTIGQGILTLLQPLIPVINNITNIFANMPAPLQLVVSGFFAVFTAASLLASPVMSLIGLYGTLFGETGALSGALGGLGSMLGLTSAETAGLSATEIGAAAAHASSAGSISAETAANGGLLASLWGVISGLGGNLAALVANTAARTAHALATGAATIASWGLTAAQWALNAAMSANPIGIIIIALIALVAIIYKVGEAFGWWDSFSGMLDAIWQGLQGIWNALTQIKPEQIFEGLKAGLMAVFAPITLVVQGVKLLWDVLSGGQASQQFTAIINNIRNVLTGLWNSLVTGVTNAVTNFVNRLKQLPQRIWQFLVQGITRIIQFRLQVFTWMVNAGLSMLTGISRFLRQLPARIALFFSSAVRRILSFVGQALANAMSFGRNVLNGVMRFITDIPGRVYQEFVNIGKRIKDAVAGAVNAALNFGKNVLDAVMGALGIHSPGFIQNNIASEFASIPGRIVSQNGNAFNAARSFGQAIVSGFGSPSLSVGSGLGVSGGLPHSIGGVVSVTGSAPSNNGGGVTIINVQSGAFDNKFDARSFTEKECKQIVGNAIQGLKGLNGTTQRLDGNGSVI